MKPLQCPPLALCALILGGVTPSLHAQGTAFTYQGHLTSGANTAAGSYDLIFSLFSAGSGGGPLATPNTNSAVAVSNGLFAVTLDFGANFPGGDRWLEIAVRTNGNGAFTTLSPRQKVTPAPYAIFANTVAAEGISGIIPAGSLGGIYANAVSFTNPGNVVVGSFSGNGAGLNNVNAFALSGLGASDFWKLGGNTGSGVAPNLAFLGFTDNLPLELVVNNSRALRLEPNTNGAPNVIGGSPVNFVSPGVYGATIAGGGATNDGGFAYTNSVGSSFGTIGGGAQNTIQTNVFNATIGGGNGNTIEAYATDSFIGGGGDNTIETYASESVIGGGVANLIYGSALFSTIGGGNNNQTAGFGAVIGGGGVDGTIYAGNIASGDGSTIGGGLANTSGGLHATVPGGDQNVAAGQNSFAAGHRAQANHQGAFVWADSTEADFASTGANQFLVRAQGGVGIGTTNPRTALHVASTSSDCEVSLESGDAGSHRWTVQSSGSSFLPGTFQIIDRTLPASRLLIDTNGNVGLGTALPSETLHVVGNILATGTITPNSDRNAKTDFAPVEPASVLARVAGLPISQWRFKAEADQVKHIGPMAQDFHAAFGLGANPTAIATVDADGVALAAIQGLNQKVEQQQTELKERNAELQELKRTVNELKSLVNELINPH
jgi:trimeric autotransporter adhesin